ncbi:hypothetical protein [Chitinophaga sancti]|uniref:Uncharacterized protein n=1 Tax=Chitinophaga sancti TaxID=1004 RepID=A0A1K1S5K2_9BACT|nr:hypothetical protein [Chitinophaga sancti]WQD63681.1 hypothetical protein U0033_04680 [Chitinophaga sancti]WQG90694.1 hypothetical protein SR876_04240 [Chitinophaga sancti]SFW79348.1 hypothetical protein SAMN05661012_04782 [Chitinophaga sancti]
MSTTPLKKVFADTTGKTNHYDEYKIDRTGNPIVMNLFPGTTGQSAVSDVIIDSNRIGNNIQGAITSFLLGTGNSLVNRYLEVYTIITDVSTVTNLTSLDFSLSGGSAPYRYKMERTVQEQGDSAAYKITIYFTDFS